MSHSDLEGKTDCSCNQLLFRRQQNWITDFFAVLVSLYLAIECRRLARLRVCIIRSNSVHLSTHTHKYTNIIYSSLCLNTYTAFGIWNTLLQLSFDCQIFRSPMLFSAGLKRVWYSAHNCVEPRNPKQLLSGWHSLNHTPTFDASSMEAAILFGWHRKQYKETNIQKWVELHTKRMRQKLTANNLDVGAVCGHELFVDVRASLSDFTDGAVDTAATSNLHHTPATTDRRQL